MATIISFDASASESFDSWLGKLKEEALQKGISKQTVHTALDSVAYLPRVIELDRKQPEGHMTFAEYKRKIVSQDRIDKGRRLYHQHKTELDSVSMRTGVPSSVIVALWGIETNYGDNTGGFGVVPALATLAYDGRRSAFFRDELFKALKIIDEGHIGADSMRGSWAGAMGQNQFMPSSFIAFAVDGDGDSRRDIWTNLSDVFASTANYLQKSGWNPDERWGRKIKLPQGFPQSLTGLESKRSLQEWKNMGISLPGGEALPVAPEMKASIIQPDGAGGPAYMVYGNYRVIMKWNKSVYFATSVGLLADLIAQ